MIAAMAGSPHVRGLRWLSLARNALTDASLEAIAASPHLTELRHLHCIGNDFDDPGDDAWIDWRSGAVMDATPTPRGVALEQRDGPRAWLRREPTTWAYRHAH